MNRNKNNYYPRKQNENKRLNNNQYSSYNNSSNNGMKNGSNLNNNDMNAKKDKEWNKNGKNCDNHSDQNMPGIAVNRSLSSPPFVSINTDINSDKTNGVKNEMNINCNNGSGDQKTEQIDDIVRKLKSINLDNNKEKNKAIEDNNDSQSKTESKIESQTKTDLVNNKETVMNVNNREKNGNNGMIRRNTTGSADNYRYNNRRNFNPNKQYNNNDKNTSYQYNTGHNNSNKFYRNNERINNSYKYESNDQNRGFKAKGFTPSYSSANTSGIDYGQNANAFINPNMYYWNGFDPYTPSIAYFVPNQYPFYSSTGYPLQQTMASNTDESNTQLAVNDKQTDVSQKSGLENDYSKDTNGLNSSQSVSFVPFQPTLAMPSPPLYIGFINPIVNENGVQMHYFVSQFPPNIVPLLLDVDSNGMPILPSNCKIMPFHQ